MAQFGGFDFLSAPTSAMPPIRGVSELPTNNLILISVIIILQFFVSTDKYSQHFYSQDFFHISQSHVTVFLVYLIVFSIILSIGGFWYVTG